MGQEIRRHRGAPGRRPRSGRPLGARTSRICPNEDAVVIAPGAIAMPRANDSRRRFWTLARWIFLAAALYLLGGSRGASE